MHEGWRVRPLGIVVMVAILSYFCHEFMTQCYSNLSFAPFGKGHA